MPHLQEAGDVAAIDARADRAFLPLLPLAAAVHAPSCLLEVVCDRSDRSVGGVGYVVHIGRGNPTAQKWKGAMSIRFHAHTVLVHRK